MHLLLIFILLNLPSLAIAEGCDQFLEIAPRDYFRQAFDEKATKKGELVKLNFFVGHPNDMALLKITKDFSKMLDENHIKVEFSGQDEIWVMCSYNLDGISIIKNLHKVRSCEFGGALLTGENNDSEHNRQMNCVY